MNRRAPLLLLLAALAASTHACGADPVATSPAPKPPTGRRPFAPAERLPSADVDIDSIPLESLRGLKPSQPAASTRNSNPEGVDRFESLSLKPKPKPKPGATPSAPQSYLAAWSAAHDGAEASAAAREIDAFLRSTPDPRALRFHLQKFISRRPAAWLAEPFDRYPSPTGDRAGAWRRAFPDLVHPDNDVLQRQRAFEALLHLFANTPEGDAFQEALAEHGMPSMLLRACRSETLPEPVRRRLIPRTLQRLGTVSRHAADRGLEATAAAVALHAHLLEGKGLPNPVTLPVALRSPAPDAPPAVVAQYHAGRLLARVWPPLSPSGAESQKLHDLLAGTPPFTEIRLARTFGITAAALVPQNEAVRSLLPPGAPDLALGGEPPRLRYAGLGDAATWAESSPDKIREQLDRVQRARQAEQEGIRSSGWARRFYNPEYYQRELAAAYGERLPLIQSTTVAEAQQNLADAQTRQGELMRDGVYVGDHPTRFNTIVTRPLDSFERRNLDFQIDVERRRLDDARRNDQHNQGVLAEHRARIRSLEDKLNHALRAIRDVEESWAPRLRALRQDVEREEAALQRLRGVGVPPEEIEARHQAVRIAELRKHRDQRIEHLRSWTTTRDDVTPFEASCEVRWRAWFTGGEKQEPTVYAIAGFPMP